MGVTAWMTELGDVPLKDLPGPEYAKELPVFANIALGLFRRACDPVIGDRATAIVLDRTEGPMANVAAANKGRGDIPIDQDGIIALLRNQQSPLEPIDVTPEPS